MPRTPTAVRPMGRTAVSRKQMAMPSWVAMRTLASPSVSSTAMSSSPSSRVRPRRPAARMFRKADFSVRFTVPLRVTMNR